MSFLWPAMLSLLVLIPLGLLLDRRMARTRQSRIAGYGSLALPSTATGPIGARSRWRRRVAGGAFVVGLTVMLIALARPQAVVSLPSLEGTVVLAFDVSGSMAATDYAPTRMEAAKAAARAFVQRQPDGVVVGVVAFSESGLAVQIPTRDTAAVLSAIDRLEPQRGTSLGQGILASLNAITVAETGEAQGYYSNQSPPPSPPPVAPGSHGSAMIVLLSDGENNVNPDPVAAAQVAADQGIRIETVGIGTTEGTTLDINGFRVHTQLNEDLLRQVADITDGTYHPAGTVADLQAVYDGLERNLVVKPEPIEITALFAGGAILLLGVGALLSLRWLGRIL